jgi:hypothetical protein
MAHAVHLLHRHWLFWLVWVCVGFGFYELLSGTFSVPEFLVGLTAAAAGATAAGVARHRRQVEFSPTLRMARAMAGLPAQAVRASCQVLWYLVRETMSGRRVEGRMRTVPYDPGGQRGEDFARRALQELAICVAPVTLSLGIDLDLKLILVHELARPGERARELGALL